MALDSFGERALCVSLNTDVRQTATLQVQARLEDRRWPQADLAGLTPASIRPPPIIRRHPNLC